MRKLHFAALAAATTLLCGTAAANAGEIITSFDQPTIGIGMICNTSDQAEQFLELRGNGMSAAKAMKAVNAEAKNPKACGIAAIAFVRDKTVDTKPVEDKLLQVERINVLAGFDGNSWQHIPSMIQYAVMQGGGDSI